jgi:molecular chaperone IbpA
MTNLSIRTLDLPTLAAQIHRHSIGFDRMFDTLNQTFANSKVDSNYPPYDLVKTGDETYEISLAVAGFAQGEIDVTFQDNILTVSGEKKREEDATREYLHRGISARKFTRQFPLAENVEVRSALARDGILTVQLERIVPEEAKPKSIAITYAS